jgi:hypothetical protein
MGAAIRFITSEPVPLAHMMGGCAADLRLCHGQSNSQGETHNQQHHYQAHRCECASIHTFPLFFPKGAPVSFSTLQRAGEKSEQDPKLPNWTKSPEQIRSCSHFSRITCGEDSEIHQKSCRLDHVSTNKNTKGV